MAIRKKILVIADGFPALNKPTIGAYYHEQIKLLEKDYDFRVIVIEGVEKPIMQISQFFCSGNSTKAKGIEIYDGVPIIRSIVNKLRQNRLTFYNIRIRNAVHRLNYNRAMKLVRNAYLQYLSKGFNPDLIICETAQYMSPFGIALGKEFEKSVIGIEHYPTMAAMTSVWDMDDYIRSFLLSGLNQLSKILSVSQYLSNVLYLNGVRIPVINIGNMINEALFKVESRKKDDFFWVSYIGYDFHLKDPETFFKTMRYLIDKGEHNIRFRLINGINSFTGLIEKYEVNSFVEYYTQLERKDVARIIAEKTDVLVSTSTSETFGLAMAEALMCGVPVIATISGGNLEFLDQHNSILVPTKDYIKLANEIIRVKNGEIVFEPDQLRKSIVSKFGREAFRQKIKPEFDTLIFETNN